jgi:hypothetical protein
MVRRSRRVSRRRSARVSRRRVSRRKQRRTRRVSRKRLYGGMRMRRSTRAPTRAGQELNKSTKAAMLEIARRYEFTFINEESLANSKTLKTALDREPRDMAIYFLMNCLQHRDINISTNKDCCGPDSTLGEIIQAYDEGGVLTGSSSQDTSGGISDRFVDELKLAGDGHDLQRQPSIRY